MAGPLRFLGRLFGGGKPAAAPAAPAQPKATYDAARHSTEDRKHWAAAKDDTPREANDPGVRAELRKRSKYECENNGYLNGLVKTLAHDLVGTGPRLQLCIPDVDTAGLTAPTAPDREAELADRRAARRRACRQVERQFAAWCRAADLAEKFRVLHESRVRKGECFAQAYTNPKTPHPVKLNVWLIGAERVCTPLLRADDPLAVDGIRFDRFGNPAEYHVLKASAAGGLGLFLDYERLPADKVFHWFRPDEPGQWRGVPETTPTLLVGAQLRRYGAAVLTAAEVAAMLAGVMETDTPADDGETPTVKTMEEVELARGSLLTLPAGWKAKQFEPNQPAGTHRDFVDEKLNEVARPHLAPRNLITGDSSSFNFASGKLDHLPYQRAMWIERDRFRQRVLDPLFRLWLEEAALAPGVIPDGLPPYAEWEWEWYWDGFDSIDPLKESSATEKRLGLGLTNLMEQCAAEGKDYEDVLRQRARELALQRELEAEYGVTFPAPAGQAAPPADPADTEEPANA